jgi:hypothetical protein
MRIRHGANERERRGIQSFGVIDCNEDRPIPARPAQDFAESAGEISRSPWSTETVLRRWRWRLTGPQKKRLAQFVTLGRFEPTQNRRPGPGRARPRSVLDRAHGGLDTHAASLFDEMMQESRFPDPEAPPHQNKPTPAPAGLTQPRRERGNFPVPADERGGAGSRGEAPALHPANIYRELRTVDPSTRFRPPPRPLDAPRRGVAASSGTLMGNESWIRGSGRAWTAHQIRRHHNAS